MLGEAEAPGWLTWARAGTDRQGQAVSQPCHLLPCGLESWGVLESGWGHSTTRGMDVWGTTAHTNVCSSNQAKSSCRWGVGRGGGQKLPQGEGSSARREERGREAPADAPSPTELGAHEGEGGTRAGPAPVPTKCCVSTRAPRAACSPCRGVSAAPGSSSMNKYLQCLLTPGSSGNSF